MRSARIKIDLEVHVEGTAPYRGEVVAGHLSRADFEGSVDENVANGFLTNEEGEAFKPRAQA